MAENGALVQQGIPQMYVDANGVARFLGFNSLPAAAVPVTNSSANQANANAVATLPGAAGKTTYITGFEVTGSGSTAGLAVNVTVAGVLGGTLNYAFVAPAGVLVGALPLQIEFPEPIPASGLNTAIVVTLPALGAGSTNATAVAHGFQV